MVHSQRQWSHLLLELNIMKKAWKPYGVNINMKASWFKKCFKLWNES